MSELSLLQTLFRYQASANQELLDAIGRFDPVRHDKERHQSIRLMNHSLIVGRIFAAHLTGQEHGYTDDNTPETPSLPDLHAALTASDQWYLQYLENITPELLSEALPFVFTDGDRGCMTRQEMLLHIVTHGGYHRGEIGRLLTQLSITPPWDTLAVHLHRADPSRRLAVAAE
ncbi:DinB family protein [Rhizobium leucaenae]|uniref:Putative damage-inducible protein DinB n=1 Tax=Rhizobium leucaenae TaxID=29450 RepID=A0A7W7EMP2_9HYPH|nr:DinB family protein [Rhizobium leucaenae]MBB4570707.1 putative damage-inducible protein DinB [Rhizobium leucaenae]MBB6303972.1 putative damage-inducible protein DinB [Rhizobium leucaenae]